MGKKILIVDDDRKTVELVKLYLENDGYAVISAHDGQNAIDFARQKSPDLVVLDLMLPKVDGIEVFKTLRAESEIPIIMLTAKTTEEDKLLGLNIGADDYVTKPFSPREVLARVKAVLRRAQGPASPEEDPQLLSFGNFTIDFNRHEARVDQQVIHLTPKEFKLLEVFSRNPGTAFSRVDLVSHAFGNAYKGLDRTIDVHIMNLRKKIEVGEAPAVKIRTVYGVGYKLVDNLAKRS